MLSLELCYESLDTLEIYTRTHAHTNTTHTHTHIADMLCLEVCYESWDKLEIYTLTYTHTCIHTYVHTYKHAHTYKYHTKHTHTRTLQICYTWKFATNHATSSRKPEAFIWISRDKLEIYTRTYTHTKMHISITHTYFRYAIPRSVLRNMRWARGNQRHSSEYLALQDAFLLWSNSVHAERSKRSSRSCLADMGGSG
jgi:hypothetical protein